ncbi:acetyltransferase [Streptomyces toyocaensis]|uniref:Acetyltransferase n=1 Tax=Streptomyces toyocaensis TaxID=55952 RepID=A0A081XR69_STRTO|nr:GNAT family N-acetyltransferase [Streptomyces toyocaensis]KES06042.1 acetyltransferase [Streptomyces toyocaensis]
MTHLQIQAVDDEASIHDWQHVHNVIIPGDVLSLDDVRARVGRNRMEVAYLDDVLIGCTTVRPPTEDNGATAAVIVRVLPGFRRRGLGTRLYERAMAQAHALDAQVIETVVLASNPDGLRFAFRHGFVEVERYLLREGDTVPWIDLRLDGVRGPAATQGQPE